MSSEKLWVSPNGKIQKIVLISGITGLKPTENCECIINVSNTTYNVGKYTKFPVVIGDTYNNFERLLDIVLTMMNEGEKANIVFKLKESVVNFTLELKSFKSDGFIFDWDARKKFNLAINHKLAGIRIFKNLFYIDALHRFSKALKLLASIPICVDEPPIEVDGLSVVEIYSLKSNLSNNLASCYLKLQDYEAVIQLCKKVLSVDSRNVKGLYKMAVSYYELHDYDRGLEVLKNVLKLDPENKAAVAKMKDFVKKVNEANVRVNAIIKKMFV